MLPNEKNTSQTFCRLSNSLQISQEQHLQQTPSHQLKARQWFEDLNIRITKKEVAQLWNNHKKEVTRSSHL